MDTLDLARLQFAGTTAIHWVFVILTMGLGPLVAVLHTRAARGAGTPRGAELERATRFWGQLYVINYVVGIASGVVVEFQFGLSWSGLSAFAGNVVGAPVALETLVAFFAESTFLGMWIFGWGRLPRVVHVALIWLVAFTAYASAVFVVVTNGFLQHPVGYRVSDGEVFLTDFGALFTNPNAVLAVAHVAFAALLTGGLVVAGVSAVLLRRPGADRPVFRRSLRTGVVAAAAAAYPTYAVGGMQYGVLGGTQPMKLAVLGPPDGAEALGAELARRYGPGDWLPPAWVPYAHDTMLHLGYLACAVAVAALVVVFRRELHRRPFVAVPLVAVAAVVLGELVGGLLYGEPGPNRVAVGVACLVALAVPVLVPARLDRCGGAAWLLAATVPLPFLASLGGWLFREGGRQPWLVYGELTTADGLSPVGSGTALFSAVAFLTLLSALLVLDAVLLVRFARRGPAGSQLGPPSAPSPAAAPEPAAF